jgi:5-methylcytosine-specific restriction protein A
MAFSTRPGYLNANEQEVLGPTGQPGTDHGQSVYVLLCRRCSQEYGANGSDIAGRQCPNCGRGRPGFEVSRADVIEMPPPSGEKSRRNPAWTRDELILALDVYFDVPSPDQHHPKVIELSGLLNRLWQRTEFGTAATLRNASGVSMKLSNFQRFDPAYQDTGRKGLAHGGRGDEDVWLEFADDRPRLKATASAIRSALEAAEDPAALAGDMSTDAEAAEGALLTRMHHYRERDASLARKRKEQALAAHGRLVCEACDFDFAAVYGERGHGFIEVHHTKPLETLQPGARTKLSELAVLCANCHRMIHARRPWLTMEELRALFRPKGAPVAGGSGSARELEIKASVQ